MFTCLNDHEEYENYIIKCLQFKRLTFFNENSSFITIIKSKIRIPFLFISIVVLDYSINF